MEKASGCGTGYVRAFPRSPGTALLDPAAFATRVFRHQPRHEIPVAFVAAPAFVWKGRALSPGAPRDLRGPSYEVFGVYSLDGATLESWKAHGLICRNVRVFLEPSEAVSYADRRNREISEQYASDMADGHLTSVDVWKASAVDAFRLVPPRGGAGQTLAS